MALPQARQSGFILKLSLVPCNLGANQSCARVCPTYVHTHKVAHFFSTSHF